MTGALEGVRVLDLTRVLAGPFCTQQLGDHGAEIIKIEPPQGDETRDWGPPFDDAGDAAYFLGVNRNKRSLALDLAREDGRAVLRRLLASSDVLIENFKPGGMEKWCLGYADLEPEFPRLVHCRISGFGADGPLGRLPGYDAVVQAQCGVMSVNGDPASGATRNGVPIVDLATGLSAAYAVSTALYERERSGRGQFIDMTLYDCGLSLMLPYAPNYFLSGKRPAPLGNRHPNLTPYETFETRGGEIFIGCGNDRQFRNLAKTLGAPELAEDPAYATMGQRNVNREALIAILKPLIAEQDGESFAIALARSGTPAGPVLGAPEVTAHPHSLHRGMIVERETPEGGRYRGLGPAVKFSRTPAEARSTPPRFAQDARALLAEAGYSEEEIDALIRSGAAPTERRRP